VQEVSRRNFLWLDSVPADWEIRPLFALGHENKKLNKDLSEQNLLSLSYGEIVEKDINSEDGLLPASFESYQVVEPGTMIFRFTDLQNDHTSLRSGLVKSRGIITNAYLGFVPKRISSRFLFYLMRALDNNKVFYGMGSGLRQSLTWDDARRIPVLAPSLEEQNEIVSYLDEETSQIDQLISKKEQLIEKLLERRQVLITRVTTKGLDHNVPMKDSGVEWLGDVPLHWSIRPLRSIASTISSPVDKKSIEGQSSVLLCNYTDVTYNDLIHADINFMQATATLDQIRGYKLKAGDTVITKDSETAEDMGLSAFVVAELSNVLCGYHLAIVRPRKKVVPRWLTWSLRGSSSRTQMTLFSRGLTRVSLGQGSLRSIKVATPPADEQTIIASFLDQETAQIDLLVEKARKAIGLLKERRQALITQVVTGKIDVRGFAGGNS
jgi:type I restriction enzyme S subunit